MLRIRAGIVHPVTAPPIEDGAVLVDDGRIVAVGPHGRVPTPHHAELLEFRDAELVPGLINCHTHLELTHLEGGRHHEPEFVKWIRRVRTLKEAMTAAELDAAAEAGIRDLWSRGVTCCADTGSSGAAMRAMSALGARGIAYQEVFGPDPRTVEISMAELFSCLQPLRRLATSQLLVGLSPHAPYTVSAELYEAVAQLGRRERLPLAVHLAESKEETLLVRDGAGPFADALRARGIAVQPRHQSPVEYLVQRGVVRRGTLCIHCVQVDETDVRLLRTVGATVAHCPRSNQAHGHGTAPLDLLREAGVPVGLGTDSIVSVGELDLWADAAAAGFAGDDALRTLTIEGARALGWESEIGSLEVGKAADLAVLAVGPSGRPAVLTMVASRIVHQAGSPRAH
jgi:aminodeoxyfutalosine deaminase